MQTLWQVDWRAMLIPSSGIVETFLRGSVMYLFLFVLMRVLRREAGALGIADLLVVVLIADASQNAMSGQYHSITEGIILVATIMMWDFSLDWIGFRFPAVRWIVRSSPKLLVQHGRMLKKNMQREMISEEELMSHLRQHGVQDVKEVERCYLEGDGHISVVRKKAEKDDESPQKRQVT